MIVSRSVSFAAVSFAAVSFAAVSFAAVSFAVACGADGSLEQGSLDRGPLDLGQADLGRAAQAFSAPVSPSYQFGTTTSNARLQCNRTSNGQVCSVPAIDSNKIVHWRFDQNSGFTDAQKRNFRIMVTGVDNVLASWTFSESEPAILFVNKAPCTGNSGSNEIEAFSCVDLTPGAALSTGPGVTGEYTTHTSGFVHIDFDDIEAKFTGEGDRTTLAMHAFGHAIISWMGLGSRSDSGAAGFVSRRQVNVRDLNLPLTEGEGCRLEAYDPTNDGEFDIISPACASD